jgi:hypothetical protein
MSHFGELSVGVSVMLMSRKERMKLYAETALNYTFRSGELYYSHSELVVVTKEDRGMYSVILVKCREARPEQFPKRWYSTKNNRIPDPLLSHVTE